MPLQERACGVLLHPSSLPGPHGLGDFGPDAHRFVDWLGDAGLRLWQMLPLNPTGPGDSPYMSPSAFAGNPLLVALEPLVESGWLAPPALPAGGFGAAAADFPRAAPWRLALLRQAAAAFRVRATTVEHADFDAWCQQHAGWLEDHALFMAIDTACGGQPWWTWPAPLRWREPAALHRARAEHADELHVQRFVQWCFDRQLSALRTHAQRRHVTLIGDLPIFVAHHSADCWARPDLYELDAEGQPTVVAGVPPDELGPDGQRWGNPLYRWPRMAAENYAWWTARLRRALAQADGFRIDHFLGFVRYWEIPAASASAKAGRWVPGPGKALFDAMAAALGPLPVIAEDLGLITPEVVALRQACGFPGMKILQFAFGGTGNPCDGNDPDGDGHHEFLPHHYPHDVVVYSGNHDNDTARGWWDQAGEAERRRAASYLGCSGADDVHWGMLRAGCNSVARLAVFPMQDLLGLDNHHRMNRPGTVGGGNWAWRFAWHDVDPTLAPRLRTLARGSGR